MKGLKILLPLILLSITNCLSGFNESYCSWISTDGELVYRLDVSTGILDAFSGNERRTVGKFNTDYAPSDMFSTESGVLHRLKDKNIITFSGSGQVFEVSFTDSTLSRLDGTYQHGFNFDAFQFTRKGAVYSYGGYGFWMENNMLIRFDESAREWFLVTDAPYKVAVDEKNQLARLRWYDAERDALYVGHYRTLYEYSFTSNTWTAKGRINKELREGSNLQWSRINDSLGFVHSTDRYWLTDWRNNSIHELDLSSNQELGTHSGIPGVHCMYAHESQMVVLKESNKVRAGFTRTLHSPVDWRIWQTERLYTPYFWYKSAFYTIVGLVVLILSAIIRRRYLNLVRKKSDWVEFLSPTDKLLYHALQIDDLDTDEVNKILEIDGLGWEVQRRKRSEAIKSINAFANKALGFDIIERHKSERDKRQVIYRLNNSLK